MRLSKKDKIMSSILTRFSNTRFAVLLQLDKNTTDYSD